VARFSDVYGNPVNDNRPLTFTKSGTPSSTGTLALQAVSEGFYATGAERFWRAGAYTLGVSGISAANTLGKRMVVVKGDTALPLILRAITPNTLSVTDSAAHQWKIRLTGENFTPGAQVYPQFGAGALPTTFISETELEVLLPEDMRQFGSTMLQVRSSSPLAVSNTELFFIVDPSLRYLDSLAVVSPLTPALLAEEQLQFMSIQQKPNVVGIRAVRLANPMQVLLSEQQETGG
jgi:hypothetical protein